MQAPGGLPPEAQGVRPFVVEHQQPTRRRRTWEEAQSPGSLIPELLVVSGPRLAKLTNVRPHPKSTVCVGPEGLVRHRDPGHLGALSHGPTDLLRY